MAPAHLGGAAAADRRRRIVLVLARTMGRYETLPIKRDRMLLSAAIPPNEPVAYVGSHYWSLANPFMYYVKRGLEPPIQPWEMRARRGTTVLADRDSLGAVLRAEPALQVIHEGPDWVLLRRPGR
jgi:hypothetical protein